MTEILLIAATTGRGGTDRRMRVARLCLRKRKLTSQPAPEWSQAEKWPTPQALRCGEKEKIFNTMDQVKKDRKGGRPRIEKRTRVRGRRVSFAVNEYDKMMIDAKLRRAKKEASVFCREALERADIGRKKYDAFLKDIDRITEAQFSRMVVMSVTFTEALSDDDLYVIRNLHKMGQRLNQLFVQGHLKEDADALLAYIQFMKDFADIKAHYQIKVKKI